MQSTPTRSPGRALLRTPSKQDAVHYAPPLPTTVFAHDPNLRATLNADMSSLDYALRTLLTTKTERKRIHEGVLAELIEEGRRYERESEKLSDLQSSLDATLRKEKDETDKAQSVVKSLEGRKRALTEQLNALQTDIAEWQAKVDAARKGQLEQQKQIEQQQSRNRPEVDFLEDTLGFKLRGKARTRLVQTPQACLEQPAGDLITITFTQLDATSYHRPFTFDLDLSSENYSVPLSFPNLPSTVLQALVAALNDTRDFNAFLKAMREAFIQHTLGASALRTRRTALQDSP